MRHIGVIGIGMGDPDHLTGQAVREIRGTEVFFVLDKGSAAADLVRAREALCARFAAPDHRIVAIPDPRRDHGGSYEAGVERWHAARADAIEAALSAELGEDGRGAFLVWGDPSLYDSTLRILDDVRRRGRLAFATTVVPGLSAPQLLSARHAVPLNEIGHTVTITTGRRLARLGWPPDAESVVVMLDGEEAFASIDPAGLEIFWGAYLGTARELLVAGPLADRAAQIRELRARARAEAGWIMDIYLLRRASRRA